MSRIKKDVVDLDPKHVRAFFENRGETIDTAHPLTSVLYQDQTPDLALKRDAFEKERVLPLLKLEKVHRVLDMGCGIGRWADALEGKVAGYHGIDFSTALILAANERTTIPNFSFQQLAVEDAYPGALDTPAGFDRTIMAGVLVYLNDNQLAKALDAVAACSGEQALFYLREPIGLKERLTLREFYSSDLKAHYNAIYRTQEELLARLDATLVRHGFKLTQSERLYSDELNNRRETVQHFFIFERS